MPVAGIGIDGGDNPVGGHSAGDGEASVVALLEILADHRGQQSSRLGHLGWVGLVTAVVAWYGSFAGVTNATWGRTVLPTWPAAK
jgi:hypothetical protein